MKPHKFSTFDVSRVLKIDRTRLQEWIDKEFIIPETPAEGRGKKALFSHQQLYQIKMATWLLKTGETREQAFNLADLAWENIGPDPDQDRFLITSNKIAAGNLTDRGGSSFKLDYPAQTMDDDEVFRFIINLPAVMRAVDQAIEADKAMQNDAS